MTQTRQPLARKGQSEILRRVFLHQNGLAVITALAVLDSAGVLARLRRGSLPTAELLNGAAAPLAVAASAVAVCGAGWLTMDDRGEAAISYTAPPDLAHAIEIFLDLHGAMRDRCAGADWSGADAVERLLDCVELLNAAKASLRRRTSVPEATAEFVTRLLEGVLAVPLLPRAANGYDDRTLAPFFIALDLDAGKADLRRALTFFAPMYGLAGSYSQALLELPGYVARGEILAPSGVTRLIDRRLNVHASAAAHRGYFHAATRLITRVFDEQPLSRQPRAIVDIGCGDGSWLRGLYEAILESTARGRSLHQYPLHLIGVDLDPVALEITARTLGDLSADCVVGDVGEPDAIAEKVASVSGIDFDNTLTIRAFVDHNRSLPGIDAHQLDCSRLEDGVYGTPSGLAVSGDAIHRNWAAHYRRWREMSGRHGMLVIEAHTLSPPEVRERLTTSHSLALQYYHALSGQSPIPYDSFRSAATSAGLASLDTIRYPDSSPTTSISRFVPVGSGLAGGEPHAASSGAGHA